MSETPIESVAAKKIHKRTKYDRRKLPTPPPDPKQTKERRCSESRDKDIFEYLESILSNYSRSNSVFAPVVATEEALDQLEKLYKLMEQMLVLRDQNAKLHRRIRELEYLNNLEIINRGGSILENADYPEIDTDSALAASILESILIDSDRKDSKGKVVVPPSFRPSILRKSLDRRFSTIEKHVSVDNCASARGSYEAVGKGAKVSKWTKVKAAFKWEKASTSVTDSKSQDSGIHVPINVEIAKYLRVPSLSDEAGHSPADSGAAGISTPGSLSEASSTEDFHRQELRAPYDDFRSSDDEYSQHNYIPQNKEEHSSTKPHTPKHSKTPWAKMKDIIHTKNNLKKKHRLSAASDDIQIDVELCTDNEDNVFEDDNSNAVQTSPKVSPSHSSYHRKFSGDLPQEIVERYQKAVEELGNKKESRWAMVKKAFIISNEIPSTSKDTSDLEDEVQRNYKQLQKKLSLEFQDKFSEWERLKQHSPGAPNSPTFTFGEETKDPSFLRKMEEWQKIKNQQQGQKSPMPSEFDLPPDFKKKLQEWEKMKKSTSNPKKKLGDAPKWKSLSGHRSETSTVVEYPVLSDDFRKKLEEWKHIKAGGGLEPKKLKDKTPSPKLTRKNSSPKYTKKNKEPDKEIHWFEKELGKIEKEKLRLERERQKFVERGERLSKLRKSVLGNSKKEVLIHTSSGYHRFEGISKKFTQKLYEWEKAQGIAPEASTFALLTKSFTPERRTVLKRHSTSNTPPLLRSKSADSVARSALNLACSLLSQQPSSLSLNDVDELENGCSMDSKSSSMGYLLELQDELDQHEPQAVLVEVEDYEEETAAPLQFVQQKHQLPVYQRQEFESLCAGETVAAPKVRRSESKRAQASYDLIEDIVEILRHLAENEIEVKNISYSWIKGMHISEDSSKLEKIFESEKNFSMRLSEQVSRLQESNSLVTAGIHKEQSKPQQLDEVLDAVQDISNELLQMAKKINHNINCRTLENFNTTHATYLVLFENIRDMRVKIQELKRHLSYVCAASDCAAPDKAQGMKRTKNLVCKTVSNDSKSSRCDTSDNSRGSQKESKHYAKADNSGINSNQGAVKKRIKFRQKSLASRTLPADSDDDEDEAEEQRKISWQHRKLSRSRTISEGDVESRLPLVTPPDIDSISKIIIPTETNYVNADAAEEAKPQESPLTIFVKTTRKLFTPIGETSLSLPQPDQALTNIDENRDVGPQVPPTPTSPVLSKKSTKDISPSIKLILAKYNQKISEQDNRSAKSGNSSGSNSPLWRSPTSERRVKAQTEKYLEDLNKLSPLLGGRREVQKSASVGYIHSGNKQVTVPFRQENASSPKNDRLPHTPKKLLTLDLTPSDSSTTSKHSPEVRQKKLQQAKEEFLRSTPVSAPAHLGDEVLAFPTRNRLSQISMGSESSFDMSLSGALIKSASAGMINIAPDAYKEIDPEVQKRGYVSLPRNACTPKANKFNFSSIASKFRKVRMRRGKDKEKSAVSALCRQSLVVDITKPEDGRSVQDVGKRDGEDTPAAAGSRSGSWIKLSLFKK